MQEFTYQVIKHLATLGKNKSGHYTLELNLVSFNGAPPKYDIRKWDREHDKMLKGVTLTEEEAQRLQAALLKNLKPKGDPKHEKS